MGDERAATPAAWTWDEPRTSVGRLFLRDLEGLWAEVLKLAAVVEESVEQSLAALCEGRVDQAERIHGAKSAVDSWETAIERECVRVLALHQPVACDLRRVAGALKINVDLERLADLSRHIAKRVKKLADDPLAFPVPVALENLAAAALEQVHHGLDALTRGDVRRARDVIEADRRVDRAYRATLADLKASIVDEPRRVDTWLRFINTARNLERIADHAARIAETVVYLR